MGRAAPEVLRIASRDEYRRWAESHPGRYERMNGEVLAMSPERMAHVRLKLRAWQALDRAVRAAGLPCEALGDGASVEVGGGTDYEPDALVNCGEPLPADALAAPNPVVLVEVLSPSTRHTDVGAKFTDYFSLPVVRHYLVVHADRRMVVHHRRREDGVIETQLLSEGPVTLDPPGLTITVEELYES